MYGKVVETMVVEANGIDESRVVNEWLRRVYDAYDVMVFKVVNSYIRS